MRASVRTPRKLAQLRPNGNRALSVSTWLSDLATVIAMQVCLGPRSGTHSGNRLFKFADAVSRSNHIRDPVLATPQLDHSQREQPLHVRESPALSRQQLPDDPSIE